MATNELSKGSRVGRFVIEETVGRGGMSVVYRARNEISRKVFALKVLSHQLDEHRQRLWLQEAQIEETIGKSPHLVQIFDGDIDPTLNRAFLVMELLVGTSLEKAPPASREIALGYLKQIATLLTQAHRAGVVHRDLKPQNLFLTTQPDGSALLKVLDFGAARLKGNEHTATHLGTEFYAAPEQRGPTLRRLAEKIGLVVSRDITPATDVWAFGLLAYEWLTGYQSGQIWGGQDSSEQIIDGIPKPSEAAGAQKKRLPPGFDDWFARCVHIDASKRFQEIQVAFGALERLATTSAAPAAIQQAPETSLQVQTMAHPGSTSPAASALSPFAPGALPAMPPPHPTFTPQSPSSSVIRASETSLAGVQTYQPSVVTERRPAPQPSPGRRGLFLAGGGLLALVLVAGGVALSGKGKGDDPRAAGSAGAQMSPAASASAAALQARQQREAEEKKAAAARREKVIGEMVQIPEGELRLGAGGQSDDEKPSLRIKVASFWMDRTEVTVEAWKLCLAEKGCSEKQGVNVKDFSENDAKKWSAYCTKDLPGHDLHPINCVDAEQAEAFCKWAGKRLPTEEEWEYAAWGATKLAESLSTQVRFPWGTEKPSKEQLNACDKDCIQRMKKEGFPDFDTPLFKESDGFSATAPAGKFQANAFGLHDLGGNVSEWTASWYSKTYESPEDTTKRVNRGANWEVTDINNARITRRFKDTPDTRDVILGFRCARGTTTRRP